MRGKKLLCFFIILFLCASGCGVWHKTKEVYQKYTFHKGINLDKKSGLGSGEKTMAKLISPIDAQLEFLIQDLKTQEFSSGQNWIKQVYQNFSWLSGIVVVNDQTRIVERYPNHSEQNFIVQDTLSKISNSDKSEFCCFVQKDGSRPKVCIVRSFYKRELWQGSLIAYFDFDSLFKFPSLPSKIIALHYDTILYNNGFEHVAQKISKLAWESKLKNKSWGELKVENENFFWLARYIGKDPIIYVVEITG